MKILILTMNDHETDVKEIVEGAPIYHRLYSLIPALTFINDTAPISAKDSDSIQVFDVDHLDKKRAPGPLENQK